MNAVGKRWMLAAALLLTMAAAGWVASQDEPKKPASAERNSAVAQRSERRAPYAQIDPVAELQLEQLRRPEFAQTSGELFPSQTWLPAPTPAAARPEPPRAPPLPFSYFGRVTEDGKSAVFLSRGNLNYAVRQGDTIEGSYRIDEIRSDALVMTYLPLQQQQTLVLGSAK